MDETQEEIPSKVLDLEVMMVSNQCSEQVLKILSVLPTRDRELVDGPCWRGELYDKIKGDVRFRKEVAEKAGLGFELPNEFSSKIRVIGPNGTNSKNPALKKCPQVHDNNQDATVGA